MFQFPAHTKQKFITELLGGGAKPPAPPDLPPLPPAAEPPEDTAKIEERRRLRLARALSGGRGSSIISGLQGDRPAANVRRATLGGAGATLS